jgi:hypothetical protein
MAGYLGHMLTISFLAMDVGLAVWSLSESNAEHTKHKERYAQNIRAITDDIKNLETVLELKENTEKYAIKEKIDLLQLQLNTLIKAEKKCGFDWKYKEDQLINDIIYTLGLLVAFGMVYCFLFPPAMIPAATAMVMSYVGTSLIFIENIIYSMVSNNLNTNKSHESKQLIESELSICLALFNQFKQDPEKDTDGSRKKRLYSEMMQLLSDSSYQDHLAHYLTLESIRTVFIGTLAPTILFVIYIFTPLSVSLAVLTVGIVLANLSKTSLEKPVAEKTLALDEREYNEFLNLSSPTRDDLIGREKMKGGATTIGALAKYSLFSTTTNKPESLAPLDATDTVKLN